MSEKIKLILVKPTVFIEDLSVEIDPSNLGIKSTNTSISPILFNLLSKEMTRKFMELKQKVFNDIAETAVTIEWREGIEFHVEDDLTFFGFPKERQLSDVKFNDYLYLMTEENVDRFYEKFCLYEEEFDDLVDEISNSYDQMIDDSFSKILSDFPSVKFAEKDLRDRLVEGERFKNSAKIGFGLTDIWLSKTDAIPLKCLREAELTANIVPMLLLRGRNDDVMLKKTLTVFEKAIQRMEKYNVIRDENVNDLVEDTKKLYSIYKNKEKAKEYDEGKILEGILNKANKRFVEGVVKNHLNKI